MGFTLVLTKFYLLVWKNYKIQFRHGLRTAVEIFLPIIVVMLAILMKRSTPPLRRGPIEYSHLSLNKSDVPSLHNTTLAWSPCRNKELRSLMTSIVPLEAMQKCFNTRKDLEIGCGVDSKAFSAAIDFGDDLIGKNCIGDKMTITLRFPAEISSGSWHTTELFDDNQLPGPRHWTHEQGYDPDYYGTGFLSLQYALTTAIIQRLMKDKRPELRLPDVNVKRHPFPMWKEDRILTSMRNGLGLLIVFCLITTCVASVLAITNEKQQKLKVLLNVVGVSKIIQWLAWFVKTFTFLMIILSMMAIMLKFFCGIGNNVFQKTNVFLLFFYFCLYACAATAFCFMISSFFKKASVAAAIAGILWFLSVAPYYLITDPESSMAIKLSCMLAINSAFSTGIRLILLFEERSEGWRFDDICTPNHLDFQLNMCHVNFMLLFDTFLCLFIGFYFEVVIPGIFSSTRRWRIFFPTYWFRQKSEDVESDDKHLKEALTILATFESDPPGLISGVKIINLTKMFKENQKVVDRLNLNVFSDQITVLLGHNGCGKSTVINMIIGVLSPTNGTIIIDNHDTAKKFAQVRARLGWCPQTNILFEELTVEEHIMLFSRLKGLSKKETNEEIEKYVELMRLQNKKMDTVSKLSHGMKRKLSTILAICGKSKICILDEPSSGMDPASRRDLWDVLQTQKNGKTILMTSHYMDEATVLGDRLAIMADGKLQALGSAYYLKKKHGAGYRLLINKTPECDVFELTKVLQSYIPSVEIESEVGNDLVYVLAEETTPVFEGLFTNLENNGERLGIRSFNINLTTMDDIFTKFGTSSFLNYKAASQNVSRQPSSMNVEEKYLSGFPLKRNHILAMLGKKFLCSWRSPMFFILPNLVLLIIMIIIGLGEYETEDTYSPKKLILSNDLYKNFTAMVTATDVENQYYKTYKTMIEEYNGLLVDWGNEEFGRKMTEHFKSNLSQAKFKSLYGASFANEQIIVWFNPEGYHVTPIALQYVLNAVLKTNLSCEDCGIEFVNHPLPYTAKTKSKIMANDTLNLAYLLGFAMVFVTGFFIVFHVKERASKFKLLQFISGLDGATYWGVAFIWDFACFSFSVAIVAIFLTCIRINGFGTTQEIGRVVLLLFAFGLAALSQTYFMSFFFKQPALAYGQAVTINFFLVRPYVAITYITFSANICWKINSCISLSSAIAKETETGPFAMLFIQVIFLEGNETGLWYEIFYTFLFIMPHFALTSGIYELGKKNSDLELCRHIEKTLNSETSETTACEANTFCCNVEDSYFSFTGHGIGKHLLILLIASFITTILIILIETRTFRVVLKFLHLHQTRRPRAPQQDDSDVVDEERRVRRLEANRRNYPLIVQDLTKRHDKILAVNRISFALQEHECFALLGTNGCGKTTTLRMVVGDTAASKGEAWIYGDSLEKKMKQVHKRMAHCPQSQGLLNELTGKETLMMFLLLRGLPFTRCGDVALSLGEKYDFQHHLNKRVKIYSDGTKRKLSVAIAAIGNSAVLVLDEPTTGIDVSSRRRIWNNINEMRQKGKCILMSTHSMEECEAISTRLAIMTNGKLKCLGDPKYLKGKFSNFHILTIKLRPSDATVQSRRDLDNIDSTVRSSFNGATLRDTYSGTLIYYIPAGMVPWSKLFGDMERMKIVMNIDEYTITQSSLEQVFFYMARLQDR